MEDGGYLAILSGCLQIAHLRRPRCIFFEKRINEKIRGRKNTTIVTSLQKDIKKTMEYLPIPVIPLISQVSHQKSILKRRTEHYGRKLSTKGLNWFISDG